MGYAATAQRPVESPKTRGSANFKYVWLEFYDGSRAPFEATIERRVAFIESQRLVKSVSTGKTRLVVRDLPVSETPTRYTVQVEAEGYRVVNFTPLEVSAGQTSNLGLMLLPKEALFQFESAHRLPEAYPELCRLLCLGEAGMRYQNLWGERAAELANLLNSVTVVGDLERVGNLTKYIVEIEWELLGRDRSFFWADSSLERYIENAARAGVFEPLPQAAVFHPGIPGRLSQATSHFREVQRGEACIVLTFHRDARRMLEGIECCMLEIWMDYSHDPKTHLMLYGLPSDRGGIGDPATFYGLRWMAARNLGAPRFEPPYFVVV